MPWISNSYCLVLCHPCEKAAKQCPVPTLGMLILQSEQGTGQGSKTQAFAHFGGLFVILLLPSCLIPALPSSPKRSTPAPLARTVRQVLEPAGSRCAAIAIIFLLNASEKRRVWFAAQFYFSFKAVPSVSQTDIPAPNTKSVLAPGCQLPRRTWLRATRGKDVGTGLISSPGAARGEEPCSPRLQLQMGLHKARAMLLGQDGLCPPGRLLATFVILAALCGEQGLGMACGAAPGHPALAWHHFTSAGCHFVAPAAILRSREAALALSCCPPVPLRAGLCGVNGPALLLGPGQPSWVPSGSRSGALSLSQPPLGPSWHCRWLAAMWSHRRASGDVRSVWAGADLHVSASFPALCRCGLCRLHEQLAPAGRAGPRAVHTSP